MNFFKKLFGSSNNGIEPTSINNPIEKNEKEILPVAQVANLNEVELNEEEKIEQDEPIIKEPSIEEINEIINSAVDDYFLKDNDLEWRDFDLNDKDSLFEDAARLIVASQCGSTSLLQRRMKLGYNRAGRLMDQLEAAGIVGPNQGSSVRDVLIKSDSDLEMYLNNSLDTIVVDKNTIDKNKICEKFKEEIEKRITIRQKEIEDNLMQKEKEKYKAAALLKERKRQIQKDAIKELIDEGLINNQYANGERREPIPQDVMDAVWQRDGGKCVLCGSLESLEFDHIIPFSKGGANTYRNLQILCKTCNGKKSNNIG